MADPFSPEEFKKPPAEVLRFFKEKGLKESFSWQDMMLDEHAHAFTVAKSAGFDVLRDIREALSKAIEERQDFGEFQKGLEPLLKAKGWWGKRRPSTRSPARRNWSNSARPARSRRSIGPTSTRPMPPANGSAPGARGACCPISNI